MRLTPSQLPAQLKRGLSRAYLVAGEEPLLLQEALDSIRAAARAGGYTEREVLDVERGFEWQRLVDTCNMPSLFASLRVIEARLTGAPDAAGSAALTALAPRVPPDVLLLVSAGKLDARARNAAWYAAFDAAGVSLYAWPLKPAEHRPWIAARLREAGLQADAEAQRLLAERTEGNLFAAAQEIRKLALLQPNGRIDAAAIAAAVADAAHFEAFGWVDRLVAGDTAGAVRGLDGLRAEGVELPPILGALALDLRKLAAAAAGYARSRDAAAAVEAAGVFKPRQPLFARALGRIRPRQPLAWIARCARIDGLAKSSGSQHAAWEELLTLALAICRGSGDGGAAARMVAG